MLLLLLLLSLLLLLLLLRATAKQLFALCTLSPHAILLKYLTKMEALVEDLKDQVNFFHVCENFCLPMMVVCFEKRKNVLKELWVP